MPAKLERIDKHPGIYRRGSRYVAYFYDAAGKQRNRSFRTLTEAAKFKRGCEADRDRGELEPRSSLTFEAFGREWIDSYHGRGRRGFREPTRESYRAALDRSYRFFDGRLLTSLTPRDVHKYVAHLTDEKAQGRALSDSSIRKLVAPLRSCLATATEDGLIRSNPALYVRLPHRPQVVEDGEDVRALTREQITTVLGTVRPEWRTFIALLAATGLRYSEAAALQWRHLELGTGARVKVRRRWYRGGFEPPKSRAGRRDVPIDQALARDLERHRRESRWRGDDDLVFTYNGEDPPDYRSMLRNVLRPAAEEAGAGWAGFHSLRHSCASMLFARGCNVVAVQKWLGHSSPTVTLNVYISLIDGELAEPLRLSHELGGDKESDKTSPLNPTQPDRSVEDEFAQLMGNTTTPPDAT